MTHQDIDQDWNDTAESFQYQKYLESIVDEVIAELDALEAYAK